MLPLMPFCQSSSFSLRFLLTRCQYALAIQRYSSSIRQPAAPFSPSSKTKRMKLKLNDRKLIFFLPLAGANNQTFDGMIDIRRQQARRTLLVHVKYR